MGIVYTLSDPRTGAIRYVGKTARTLEVRVRSHFDAAHSNSKRRLHVGRWLRSLEAASLKPIAEVVEEHTELARLADAERFYISYFRSLGLDLTNHTDGGEGCSGYLHSVDSKRKMSRQRAGAVLSSRQRAGISKALIGNKNRLGIPHSSDVRAKMVETRNTGSRRIVDIGDGTVYRSCAEAARKLGLLAQGIRRVLKGGAQTVGGHRFKYLEGVV